jgi:hypothetical protein
MHCSGRRSQFCTCHRSLVASRVQRFTVLAVVRCLSFARPSLALSWPVRRSVERIWPRSPPEAVGCELDTIRSSRSRHRAKHTPGLTRPAPKPASGPDRLDACARVGRRGSDRHRTTGDSAAPGRFCGAPNGRRLKFWWRLGHALQTRPDPAQAKRPVTICRLKCLSCAFPFARLRFPTASRLRSARPIRIVDTTQHQIAKNTSSEFDFRKTWGIFECCLRRYSAHGFI